MALSKYTITLVLLLFITSSLSVGPISAEIESQPISNIETPSNFSSLSEEISLTNILGHINNISGLGSRVTGYNGLIETADYIAEHLSSYGLSLVRHSYKTIVPIDEGSSVIVLDTPPVSYGAYAVWPNGIQTSPTPPEGLTGPIIYVGKGELKEFDGKEVSGSIVLMDYESGDNWLNAAKFGAKGVIFVASLEPSIYPEALKKFLDTPIYFPRLFVDYETGQKLHEAAEKGLSVRIHSRIYYREIKAENVIGVLDGSKRDETILVSTHYDSWSPVPALANSPYEAISPAYLLELARVMAKTQPARTVWFVFFSGHWEALSGAREFVEDYYFSPMIQNGTIKPLMLINVGDLDPSGSGLDLIRGGVGTLYGTTDIASGISLRYAWTRRQIFTSYLREPTLCAQITNLTGTEPTNLVRDYFTHNMFWGTENYYYMLDSEPAEMTRGISFTVQTAYTSKQWRGDPFQTYEISLQQLSFLNAQLVIISHIVNSFTNESAWGESWSDIAPSRVFISPGGFRQYSGFITLKGKTLEYNLSSGWYSLIPNALVRVSLATGIRGTRVPHPFNNYLAYSDENGSFEIHGLSPYPFIPSEYIIDAWVVNETTGKILYAPNMGIYGSKAISSISRPLAHPETTSVVLMEVGAITLFDVINPHTGMTGLVPDSRSPTFARTQTRGWLFSKGIAIMPQSFTSKGEPLFYGTYYNGYETVALAFALPRSEMVVMGRTGGVTGLAAGKPTLILVNSSETEPEGHAIRVMGEAPSVFDANALNYAKDIIVITRSRYDKLAAREVRSISVEEKLSKAEAYLEEAMQMYLSKNYSVAHVKALNAWAMGSSAYRETMTIIDDSGVTSLFFFSLIIPVSILLERLLLHSQGKRQLIYVIAIGTVLLALFGFVHPALTLMANVNLAILGLVSFTLFAIATAILGDETQKMMKELSYRLLGYHTVETGRLGLVTTTFSVAIENMRRRKFRSLLVLTNLITIAFAFASLTSVSPYTGIKFVPWRGHAPYTGIFIKSQFSVPPNDLLGTYTIDVITGVVGPEAKIMPRAWYYPASIGPNIGVVTRLTSAKEIGKNITYPVNAMLGMTLEDIRNVFTNYSKTPILDVVEGAYCLIPDTSAEVLGVSLGDSVICQGVKFRIIGILDTRLLAANEIKDLSDISIAPTDPYYVNTLSIDVVLPMQAGEEPQPLSWSRLIIVPFHVAMDLGGYVAEVSIRFASSVPNEDLVKLSRDLAYILDVPVYVGVGGRSFATSKVPTFSALGLEGIIVILALGSLNVVATLFSIQRERTRDMYVYTTVGLSPGGATIMCMLESIIYSLLGVLIGFFIGFVGNVVFVGIGMLPSSFTFNYASLFLVFSLLSLLLAALASSLYPAYLASRLITPSLERKWKAPTKPKGGIWEIPLPLKIPEIDEVRGLIIFFKEYYLGAGAEKAYFHVTKVDAIATKSTEPKLCLEVALAPFEAGITEHVTINTLWNESDKKYDFTIVIKKTLGDENLWAKGSYFFVDDLRTQILLWRFLKVEDRNKYIQMAKKEA